MDKFLFSIALTGMMFMVSCDSDKKEDQEETAAATEFDEWVPNAIATADHLGMALSASLGEMVELSKVKQGKLSQITGNFEKYLESDETGIDVNAKAYAFVNMDMEEQEQWGAVLFRLENEETFIDFLQDDIGWDVSEENGLNRASNKYADQTTMVLWKGANAAFIGSDDENLVTLVADRLFEPKTASEEVMQFVAMKEHISFMMDLHTMSGLSQQMEMPTDYQVCVGEKLEGSYVYGGIDFTKGQASITGRVDFGGRLAKEQFMANKGVGQNVVATLSNDEPVLLTSYRVDPKKMFDFYHGCLTGTQKLELEVAMTQAGISLDDMVNAFSGEFAIAVYNPKLEDGGDKDPFRFVMTLGLNDEKFIHDFMATLNEQLAEFDEMGAMSTPYGYRMELGMLSMFTGKGEALMQLKDNTLAITLSDDLIFTDGEGNDPGALELLGNYPSAMYADLDKVDPEFMKLMDAEELNAYFESVEFFLDENMMFHMYIKARNKEKNILETMIDFMNHKFVGEEPMEDPMLSEEYELESI